MLKIGLIGYGKAGQAVANVLGADPSLKLEWIAKRTNLGTDRVSNDGATPVIGLDAIDLPEWLDAHPVDALVDFSSPEAVHLYGEEVRRRKLMLVTGISAYSDVELAYIRSLGETARVICSPNMTLGINFVILAAKLLREIAPTRTSPFSRSTFATNLRSRGRHARSPRPWMSRTKASLRCGSAGLSDTMRSCSAFRIKRCGSAMTPSGARPSARAPHLHCGNWQRKPNRATTRLKNS
jgi:hypothetical protein